MYQRQDGWVGAPLLRKMISQALVELDDDLKRTADETEALVAAQLAKMQKTVLPSGLGPGELQGTCVEVVTVFKQASRTSDPRDRASVLRVATQYTSPPRLEGETRAALTASMQAAVSTCDDPDILVMFDYDSDSRHAAQVSLPGLRTAAGKRITVVGFAGEVREDSLDWLASLTSDVTGGPARTVAVVRAEELRKAGLIIVESGPIERTVRDLFPYLDQPPLSIVAKHAEHLVILFEEVGAIYVRLGRPREGWIHLASNSDWIAFENGARFGRTPGRMSITLAAIVRQVAGRNGEGLPDLSEAVRLGVVAFNRYFTEGYDPQHPLSTLESVLSYQSRDQLKALVEGRGGLRAGKEFFISTLAFPMQPQSLHAWTRLDAVLRGTENQSAERLRLIVKRGPEAAFRTEPEASSGLWHPRARILCPYMKVGELKTFDEEEIAGFTSLTKLFRKYLQTPTWKTPMSIAVFGPPGTGKSFGVRELMKSINPAAEKELTFNLSQLTSVEALNDAFHDVQHRVLSSDEVPLVFFDEFDAGFGGTELGWLKYFLAPMQDGIFRGRATDYRVGRAFFVFAGGTSDSFADFKTGRPEDEARKAKLPDFVSRLQGFLDIQTINPPEDKELDSPQKKRQREIKRALLLRSLLLTHAKPILRKQGDVEEPNIDGNLIDAFINAGRYEHGLRSMESVVRMSKWVDGAFIPASLPAKWLLEMHVTGLTIHGSAGAVNLC
jgi:hypothetical protein